MTEQDERLSRLYRAGSDDVPGAFTDAYLRRQARAALVTPRKRPVWFAPLALAATVVLAIGVLLRVSVDPAPRTPEVREALDGLRPPPMPAAPRVVPGRADDIEAAQQRERAERYRMEQEIRRRMAEERRQLKREESARRAAEQTKSIERSERQRALMNSPPIAPDTVAPVLEPAGGETDALEAMLALQGEALVRAMRDATPAFRARVIHALRAQDRHPDADRLAAQPLSESEAR